MAFAAHANEGCPGSVKARINAGNILPPLPDDLALCILARLPLSLRIRCSLVCRSWKDTMEPARIASIRKSLKISEVWPVLVSTVPQYSKDVPFTMLNPSTQDHHHRICLPDPFLHRVRPHLDFDFLVMGAVGSEVLVAAVAKSKCSHSVEDGRQLELMQGVYSFDCLSMKWQGSLYASLPVTVIPCRFQKNGMAVDMDGGYLYVAGGYDRKVNLAKLQGVERLDIKTKSWEALPDPHVKRILAAALVMGGLFYMIGGDILVDWRMPILQNSGEIWDPAIREWTLVPELWPAEVFQEGPEGRVVVMRDKLYALRRLGLLGHPTYKEELMYYECASKKWLSLGLVPLDVCDEELYGDEGLFDYAHLLKIGDELWVGLSWPKVYVATQPTIYRPLTWRTLPSASMVGLHFNAIFVGELEM